MTARAADIVIVGAGIAGLWTFHRLKKRGYDVLLLEKDSIGGDQTIASQGIIHSGLKFAIAGKISTLARSISAMPDIWRTALKGERRSRSSHGENSGRFATSHDPRRPYGQPVQNCHKKGAWKKRA
jgi:glycine/D-amino acid oxidase-like deaminating enzyme